MTGYLLVPMAVRAMGGQRRRAAAQLPPVAVLEQGTAVSRLVDLLEEVTGATLTDEQRARVLGPGQDG